MLVLATLAAVAGWVWLHRDPALRERGTSAYAQGDWYQAADLARRWVKSAPRDLEAIRLLARSTARLGRDGPANTLFSRLGSDALQAEDLYLLGRGLDRAGQKDAAGRLWEKALRLQPDHADTIEQLIIRDTAQNRLAEAAALAERLARQPGWELRGELNLGALRSELNDPAGAAAVLKRAMDRPEAASLDLKASSAYRKLLARTLLQTSRADEAAGVLRKLLEKGADPEASWLLSRAALQAGAISEASAALQAAGSYRADHPLESEPSPYVGERQCTECHRDASRALQASRHATTLTRGESLMDLPYPRHPVPDPDDPKVTHTFRLEDGKVRYETRANDRVLRAVIDYAFGSPDHYVSLVGRDDHDRSHILRLSRFDTGHDSGWVRTTGHSADAGGGSDYLGKPLDVADGVLKCLFCHTTNPRAVIEQAGPAAHDRAIGCERCHGPGELHIKAVAAKFPDLAIIRPAEATAEGRLRLCAQCHGHHQELSLPRTDSYWVRFQGTTLPWSRCYIESDGSLDCMTCHAPHHDTDRSMAHYEARCLNCHSPNPAAKAEATPRKPSNGDRSGLARLGLPGQLDQWVHRLPYAAVQECRPAHQLHRPLYTRPSDRDHSEPQIERKFAAFFRL